MTREELRELMKELVAPVVADAVQPLKEQQTQWMKTLHDRSAPPVEKPEKGIRAAKFIRAIASCRGDIEKAAHQAKKYWGAEDEVTKTLAAGEPSAGGILVPPSFSSELIELLRNTTVVRRMGPRSVPMPVGTITIPKQTGGTSVAYVGENQNIETTTITTGVLTLTWKKLAAIVPISNDLLRFETFGVDALVRDDLTQSMALREDTAFLRGDGLQDTPKGIRNWLDAGQVQADDSGWFGGAFGTVDTPDVDEVTTILGKMILSMIEQNARMINPGWIMAPRTQRYLMDMRDPNANFVYRPELVAGRLEGFPVGVSNQVPINLGGGSDESELYLVDFADVIIGESDQLLVDSSSEAAYWDGSAVQASFSRDQSLIRVIARHDLGMRHTLSGAVATEVRWGA